MKGALGDVLVRLGGGRSPSGLCARDIPTRTLQVDQDVKREDINKLGAFIRHFTCMLAVYTDVYLLKVQLVCVIACFLSLELQVPKVSRARFARSSGSGTQLGVSSSGMASTSALRGATASILL